MSCGPVSGIERPPGFRVNHTSPSSGLLLPLCAFSHCYSKRPWTLFLGFFVVLAILGPLLPFIFGRIIEIRVFLRVRATNLLLAFPYSGQNQRKVYREVLVAGDLSQEDIARTFPARLQYGRSTSDTIEFVHGNDTVYFAQPSRSQFIPGGSGAGSFNPPASIGLKNTPNDTLELTGRITPMSDAGAFLRYAPLFLPEIWLNKP